MAKSYPTMKKDRAVGNKHNRIISNVYKDRGKIYFDRNTDITYMNQIKEYRETIKHDDAPDSLAGFLKVVKKMRHLLLYGRCRVKRKK